MSNPPNESKTRPAGGWLPWGAEVFAVLTSAGPLLVIELASGARVHAPVTCGIGAWTSLCSRAWDLACAEVRAEVRDRIQADAAEAGSRMRLAMKVGPR
jgi:hypothetical protein